MHLHANVSYSRLQKKHYNDTEKCINRKCSCTYLFGATEQLNTYIIKGYRHKGEFEKKIQVNGPRGDKKEAKIQVTEQGDPGN